MAESRTITREMIEAASKRIMQRIEDADHYFLCDADMEEAVEIAREEISTIVQPQDAARYDGLTAGIKAGLEAAIRGIDATILNMGGECGRRGFQDPETGEVPCEGEEDRGCTCSDAMELGARLIKNLRTCDVAKIAALATGGAR